MQFHHPTIPKTVPYFAYVAPEPQAEQIPHESSPSLPIVPQLDQRQRPISYDRVMADITNITPNFSNQTLQKAFFPTEVSQKIQTNAESYIENSENQVPTGYKPGPIMVMDQYNLSAIPEKYEIQEYALKEHERKSMDQQRGQIHSLETVGTSLDELRSSSLSERANHKLQELARPSHSIWSSVSHIEDHEVIPLDNPEDTKHIYTFETKNSSRKETATLIHEIENLFEDDLGVSSDACQGTVFKNLLNNIQKNKVRVTRIKVETVLGHVKPHRSSLSNYTEKGSVKQVTKSSNEVKTEKLGTNMDIEKVENPESQQSRTSGSKLNFQKARDMKDELANSFEKLKGETKELLETDYNLSEKFEDFEKAPRQIATEDQNIKEEEEEQREFEELEKELEKKANFSLEEAREELEKEKSEGRYNKSVGQETLREKDEIIKIELEDLAEIKKVIQESEKVQKKEKEKIEVKQKEKDQGPSAWIARLVTVVISVLFITILGYQLFEE